MRVRLRIAAILLIPFVVGGSCSGPTLPPTTEGGGWILETLLNVSGEEFFSPSTTVSGQWQADLPGAQGSASPFTVTTDDQALAVVYNGRAPANWILTWVSDPTDSCDGIQDAVVITAPGGVGQLTCIVNIGETDSVSAFTLAPTPLLRQSPPSSATITGSGFTAQYGMPLVQYYSLSGTLVSQEQATSVSADGKTMTGSVGNISQAPTGTYAGFVNNETSSGGWQFVGTTFVDVADADVAISGDEQSTQKCLHWVAGGDCLQWETIYDSGTVSITINGSVSSTTYGESSTSITLALALVNAINANTSVNSLVIATASGGWVMISSKTGSQYSLSSTSASSNKTLFPDPSFSATASGSKI